jgi:hypothetical protein
MTDPITPKRHPTLSLSISEGEIAKKSPLLSHNLNPTVDNKLVRDFFPSLWHCVNGALKMDSKLSRPLAGMADFHENVKKRGEDEFISSLKKLGSQSSPTKWTGLLRYGMCFISFELSALITALI